MIINKSKHTTIASKTTIADTFASRLVGLLKHKSLLEDEALIITRCNSIHMFFMRFAIDAIFVDINHRVVGLTENIKPNHLSRVYWKSSFCIEVSVGTIIATKTEVGDLLDTPLQ